MKILPYDPIWEVNFIKLRKNILYNFRKSEIRCEHIGSTSVKGLSSKPYSYRFGC